MALPAKLWKIGVAQAETTEAMQRARPRPSSNNWIEAALDQMLKPEVVIAHLIQEFDAEQQATSDVVRRALGWLVAHGDQADAMLPAALWKIGMEEAAMAGARER